MLLRGSSIFVRYQDDKFTCVVIEPSGLDSYPKGETLSIILSKGESMGNVKAFVKHSSLDSLAMVHQQ